MVHQRPWWFISVEVNFWSWHIWGPHLSSDPYFVCGELLFGLRKTRDIYNLDQFGWFFCRQPRCFGLPAARANSLKSRLAEKMGVSHLDLPGKSLFFFAEMHWRCYFWRSDGGCRPSEQIWWTRPLQLGNMQKIRINEVEFRHVVNMTHGSVDTTKCL